MWLTDMLGTVDSIRCRRAYFYVIRTVRAINSLRRTALGKNLEDAGDLLKDVQLLSILPALAGVFLTPNRFFRHISSKGKVTPPFISKPLKFLITVGALVAILLLFIHIDIDTKTWWITAHHRVEPKTVVAIGLIIFSALSPIALTFGGLVMSFATFYIYAGSLLMPIGYYLISHFFARFERRLAFVAGGIYIVVFGSWFSLPNKTSEQCWRYAIEFRTSKVRWFTGAFYFLPSVAILLCSFPALRSFEGAVDIARTSYLHYALNILLAIVVINISTRSYAGMSEGSVWYPEEVFYQRHLNIMLASLRMLADSRRDQANGALKEGDQHQIASRQRSIAASSRECCAEIHRWRWRLRHDARSLEMAKHDALLGLIRLSGSTLETAAVEDYALVKPLIDLLPALVPADQIGELPDTLRPRPTYPDSEVD